MYVSNLLAATAAPHCTKTLSVDADNPVNNSVFAHTITPLHAIIKFVTVKAFEVSHVIKNCAVHAFRDKFAAKFIAPELHKIAAPVPSSCIVKV